MTRPSGLWLPVLIGGLIGWFVLNPLFNSCVDARVRSIIRSERQEQKNQ